MIEFIGCEPIKHKKEIIEITAQEKIIDLHNACEFVEFKYSISKRELSLFWDWYETENIIQRIAITLKEVNKLEILPRDKEMPFTEDDCLDKLVYNQKQNSIVFYFWGGMVIKCNCNFFEFQLCCV